MNDFDDESDTDERLSSVSAERSPVFATVGGTPTHMQAGRGRRAPAPMQIRLDTLDLGPSASSATTFSATSLSSASEVPTIRVIPEELPAALRQQQQQQNRASRGPRSPNSLSPTSIGFRAKPTLPARPAFPAAGRTSTSGTASALYRGFVVPHIHDQGHDHAHDHGHDALAHGRGIPLPHTTLLFAGQPAPGAEFDLESVLHGHTPHDHTYNPLTHPFTHDDFLPPPAARERSRSAPNFGLDIQRLALAMATNPNFTLGLDLATTLAGGALGGGFDAMPAVGNNFHQPAELSVPAMATPPILSKGIEDWENELFDVTGQQGLG